MEAILRQGTTAILLVGAWAKEHSGRERVLEQFCRERSALSITVDVIVPVYGNWSITANCLDSLARQTLPHRVIVVDDKSLDDTVERVSAEYPHVELVALPVNSGFASACNSGLARATADVVVLFNNDVVAEPDLLEHLIRPFDDPSIGSSAPLLFRPDGTIDAFGISADVTVAGFVRMHGATLRKWVPPTERLLGPYGAVAAYRRSALNEVGGLDEGIFMYGEELDLNLRLSSAGWKPAAAPEARGVHLGGATAGAGSARQRERAGFGRAYLLRAYRVLRGRHGARALLVEIVVCLADAFRSRDFAAVRGRVAGWRAARLAARRLTTAPDIDSSIGLLRSITLRTRARC